LGKQRERKDKEIKVRKIGQEKGNYLGTRLQMGWGSLKGGTDMRKRGGERIKCPSSFVPSSLNCMPIIRPS
jgi:hypothetical protein